MYSTLTRLACVAGLLGAGTLMAETPRQGLSADFSHGAIKVSSDGRHLVHTDGTPFFYLGCTVWDILYAWTREQVDVYLENRRQRGFTALQGGTVGYISDWNRQNRYGNTPFVGGDISKPNEPFWVHVDYIVAKAYEKGIMFAYWPGWGGGMGSDDNAKLTAYGKFLGQRYGNKPNFIFVMGGDCGQSWQSPVVAKAIKSVAPNILCTYHPVGPSRSEYFHSESWYDFAGFQTGHFAQNDERSYTFVTADYLLTPAKPTVDLEARYENFCVGFDCGPSGRFDAYDVRQAAWWSVFAGAAGHGYGSSGLWDTNNDQNYTNEGMNRPGAWDVGHVRALVESRPMLSRVPDQSLIISGSGSGADHMQACRSTGCALIYFSTGQTASIATNKIGASRVKAWWYDCREGTAQLIDETDAASSRTFDPPGTQGRGNDWVLVLDDATKSFPPPGQGGPIDNQDPPVFSAVTVTPSGNTVYPGSTLQFIASAADQYGFPLSSQPASFTWSMVGQGSIVQTGLFTAAATDGGPYQISAQATVGAITKSGTATVSVNANPSGLNFDYYLLTNAPPSMPNFNQMTPSSSGQCTTFTLAVAEASDNFGIRFNGRINIAAAGNYTFYTTSDDASMLYIDGALVVNNDGLHAALEKSGSVNLAAGMHTIRVDFMEGQGGEILTVNWQGPGISKQTIPPSVLFRPGGAVAVMGLANSPATLPVRLAASHGRLLVTLRQATAPSEIKVLDAAGRMLQRTTVAPGASAELLSGQSPGVFFVDVTSAGIVWKRLRVVLER